MTRIRPATEGDGAAVARIYEPAVVDSVASFEAVAPTPAEMSGRISATVSTTPWLVFASGNDVLGYAYAGRHRDRAAYQWSVEVSAYVRADAHRRGIARGLYVSLFAVLRLQGYRSAFAGITLPNEASVALHTALGFTRVGVFEKVGYKAGAWHDVLWLQREIAPRVIDPPAPSPLPAVIAHPGYQAALGEGEAHISP